MTIRNQRFAEMFINWGLLRFLWGPINFGLACLWAFQDDMAEDVVLVCGLMGTLGTGVGVATVAGMYTIATGTLNGLWLWLAVGCGVFLYIALAFVLRALLVDRRLDVFTLSR